MNAGSVALAAGLAFLLAGCSQGGGGVHEIEVAPGYVIETTQAPKPSQGRVAGIVGDDALYPLQGASILLMGTDLSTTTDSAGRFALLDVPPGIYILEARLKDHADAQTTVDVQADQTAKAILLMPRIPPTDPYHVTVQHESFYEFSGAGAVALSNNTVFTFELDPSAPRTVILESTWDGTFVSSGRQEPLNYRITDPANRDVSTGNMPNPFVVALDARILTPGHTTFTVRVEPNWPEPIVYQGQGHDFVTVFYNAPAPPGWSLLSGST